MRRRKKLGPENQRGSFANGPVGLLGALAPFFGPVTRGAFALGAASPAGSGAAAAGLAAAGAEALSVGTTLVAFGGVFTPSVVPPGGDIEGAGTAAGGSFVSEQPEAITTAATASVSQQE
ncbi:MAG: hypothetical protein RLZZ326_4347 [Planctomycetota bacterium]|jgi:hypothetical protein